MPLDSEASCLSVSACPLLEASARSPPAGLRAPATGVKDTGACASHSFQPTKDALIKSKSPAQSLRFVFTRVRRVQLPAELPVANKPAGPLASMGGKENDGPSSGTSAVKSS